MTTTIQDIQNNTTYQQVISDSFGGCMYNTENLEKYDSTEVLKLWDDLSESEKQASGGIMKGAISFLKGE